jgi:hypothetical protein
VLLRLRRRKSCKAGPLGASLPQPRGGNVRPLAHGLELLPHDRGMNFGLIKRLRGEPAVRAGHDILASDQIGEADQPFGDQFGMLDNVAGMRNDAGAQHFPFGYLQPLEQMVFVFVAWIRSLEAERAGIDFEHVGDDLGQVRFVDAGSLVDAVAGMKADPLGGNASR